MWQVVMKGNEVSRQQHSNTRICFFGLYNLPVLAPEYGSYGNGGREVQHTLLARSLVSRGYHVSMVVGDYGQNDGASWDGITTYKAFSQREGIPVLRYIHPRWTKMWSALRRADADIYFVSAAGMQVGLLAMFCQRYNKKFVFRVALDTDCDPRNLPVQYARDKYLYKYGLRRADAILVQSEKQKAMLLANYGLESRITTSLLDVPKQDLDLAERDIDVLWVSNIREMKRPLMALDLAERMPTVNFHMVGGIDHGQPGLYEAVEARAATLPNVTFHGRVAYAEIGKLFDRSRVFLNTSRMEGFPNTYMQSWIRGVPVVGTFNPDGILQGDGLGFPAETVEQLDQGISSFLNDEELLLEAGKRCRAYMSKRFDTEKILEPYTQTFQALVEK